MVYCSVPYTTPLPLYHPIPPYTTPLYTPIPLYPYTPIPYTIIADDAMSVTSSSYSFNSSDASVINGSRNGGKGKGL